MVDKLPGMVLGTGNGYFTARMIKAVTCLGQQARNFSTARFM